MRLAILPVLALASAGAVAGCASRTDLRALQAPAPAPTGVILAPYEHELRDAVALEWIGGLSEKSYLFAEPNQEIMRPALLNALDGAGLLAGTNVRARYGLRALAISAKGPDIGGDARAQLRTRYTLVERATGQTVFEATVSSDGRAIGLNLSEHDFATAARRSQALLRIINPAAAAFIAADLLNSVDAFDSGEAENLLPEEEWTQSEWDDFWEIYAYGVAGALVAGPVSVLAEQANPTRYLPLASDAEIARARTRDGTGKADALIDRDARARAARANQRAVNANVSAFLVELAAARNIPLTPVLPCHGGPAVEAAKRDLLRRGSTFVSDDCRAPR